MLMSGLLISQFLKSNGETHIKAPTSKVIFHRSTTQREILSYFEILFFFSASSYHDLLTCEIFRSRKLKL